MKIKGALFVDKIQAEETITSAFTTLIEKLQAQEEYDSKTIINDLHTLAKALQTNSSVPINLHTLEQNFELEYKALAEESIESYAQTKESVVRLNREQQRAIASSAQKGSIKIDELMHNFSSLNDQIEAQMIEANETIRSLHQQISVLEKTSNLDPLTRTFNRRALDTYLNSLCTTKGKVPNSRILLIDIDDFKVVNDTYGHLAGDRILMFLAKLIGSSLRDGDKVFRFGGEEFLILLNRSNEKACESIAKRIIEGVRTNTLLYKEHKIKITLSMGSATFKKGDTFESFIGRADKALYKAKQNGKDQLVAG